MLLVSINRLSPGTITAAPVPHPRRPATHLVEADVKLTQGTIRRLKQLGVAHAWTKHPLVEDLDRLILSEIPERRRAIYDTLKNGFNELQDRAITTDDYRHYSSVIASLISELLGRDARAGDLAERLFQEEDELSGHCANVAYLAINVGMHLERYVARLRRRAGPSTARDLTSLGVGAMLHDIGKLQCHRDVRKQHTLSNKKHADYSKHVIAGFEMLRHKINPVATTVALHHHQRWDGAGWPNMAELTHGRFSGGMKGQRIHVFARIVAAANTFDHLTTRPDSTKRPAVFALHTMQSEKLAPAFDPIVLDAFLRFLPPFPTGVEVVLSDDRLAAVTEINTSHPCRPKVRPLDDNTDGSEIDLSTQADLAIQESQGFDVSRWLYELPPRSEAQAAAMAESFA